MSAQSPARPAPRTDGASLYGLYVLALAAALLGNLLIRLGDEARWFSPGVGVGVALLSAGPLVLAAVWFWRLLRGELDEMLQRVVLEGMAFALTVFIPMAALYLNLRTAGIWVPRLDPPDILMAPALLVAVGIAFARARYQ